MAQTSTKVINPPKRYTYSDLEKLWVDAGGDKFIAPVMAAIALAENNTGDPSRTSGRNKDGTVDRGLWQINSSHGYGAKSYNPQENAKQAVAIYHSQGLTAWSTFTHGDYLKHLPSSINARDKQGLNNYLKKHPTRASMVSGNAGHLQNPLTGIANALQTGNTGQGGGVTGAIDSAASSVGGPIVDTIMLGLKEAMYAMAIAGGAMLILVGLAMIGLDVGLGGFQSVQRHPVVRYVNTRTSRGGSSGPVIEDTSTGDLPGPE